MNLLAKSLCQFWKSSIGKKLIVAITGAMLVIFLLGHLAGNLLTFQGPGAMNDYAEFLHTMVHGMGVWIARIGLVVMFVLHIVATVALTRENRAAKADKYEHDATVVASKSSQIMIWSGLIVLAFIVFHLLHFTVRIDSELANMRDPDNPARHDAWGMVIVGFQNPLVSVFYIIAMTLLCSHLSHGIGSIFQTLGLRSRKTSAAIDKLSLGLAIVIWLGFVSIPLSVMAGFGQSHFKDGSREATPLTVKEKLNQSQKH